jgi:hypothetical protein
VFGKILIEFLGNYFFLRPGWALFNSINEFDLSLQRLGAFDQALAKFSFFDGI